MSEVKQVSRRTFLAGAAALAASAAGIVPAVSGQTFLGTRWTVTDKRVVGGYELQFTEFDGSKMYIFADPKFIGRHYILDQSDESPKLVKECYLA